MISLMYHFLESKNNSKKIFTSTQISYITPFYCHKFVTFGNKLCTMAEKNLLNSQDKSK